ncbi:berberine bridge enzyme-like 24 [Aristolochia californica]|uniref:berberine bridge enzyme-like 24 n=1 Tax=Aristolochia californica TaxID=171875 RepID=UPI0035DB881A
MAPSTAWLPALVLLLSFCIAVSATSLDSFLQCLSPNLSSSANQTQVLYFPNTVAYNNRLQSSLENLRFNTSTTPKPLLIIAPTHESQVQAAVFCCKEHGIQMRVRGGGHDYEGLSFVAYEPFVVVDLVNLKSITVNIQEQTAWVQAGSLIGELYYRIAEKSGTLGFPAGLCPSVGVGGLFGGGGIGSLVRKYGLAADNVIDALLVDSNSMIRDRKSMGEDLFWAIRGGGACSFGVILSWKIKLVAVPPTVTVFNVAKTLEQGATKVVNRWQYVAEKCHENVFIRVRLQAANVNGSRTVQALFDSLYVGGVQDLLTVMEQCFPELGLQERDCTQMSWIDSTIFFGGYSSGSPREVLLSSDPPLGKATFKAKSDFVKQPISEDGLEGIWKFLLEEMQGSIQVESLGGKMNEISDYETPFPHRRGYLYDVLYFVGWQNPEESKKSLDWVDRLYKYMTPYVTKSPRTAYLNYRDLDLGVNRKDDTTFLKSSVWGVPYFKGNFRRLALVKGKVDKYNFFWNEQSIPPL